MTMKAIVYRRYGDPDVLELADLAEPKVAQNSILVRVKAAGINPADLALRAGLGAEIMETWFPVVPGWDVAGIVERVGAGVSEFVPGDEVIGYLHSDILHSGTYAEKVAGPVSRFVRKPTLLSWEQSGALPLAALTAWQAIESLGIRAGETLLVHGASGGVGSLAVQFAIGLGARVIGAASARNHDFLRTLGAEPLVHGDSLTAQVRTCAPDGVDAVLDCFGHGVLGTTADVGRIGVRSASIADAGVGIRTIYARPGHSDLVRVASVADQGKLHVRIAATFPLAEAAKAHQFLGSMQAGGKVVLLP